MHQALELAKTAAAAGEIPVGAVLVSVDDQVLAATTNQVTKLNDPTAHAELLAIRKAVAARGKPYLEDCTLYVTLEPCAMCAQALSWARVGKVYFGAYDTKSGGMVNGARVVEHAHFKPEIYGGMLEDECRELIQNFFAERR